MTAAITAVNQTVITTDSFKMPHAQFVRALAARFGGTRLLMALCVLLAATLAAGLLADWRWAVVALMLIFVAAPMVAAYLYFAHGLRRECYVNIAPHTVSISPQGLKVEVSVMPYPTDETDAEAAAESVGEAAAESSQAAEQKQETAAEPLRTYTLEIDRRRLGRYTIDPRGITIRIESPDPGFIRLPYSAFASEQEFARAVELLAPASNTV